jgi:hypothetical protein
MQWEDFIRHVAADGPWHHGLIEASKAFSLPSSVCRAGKNGAGWTCRTSNYREQAVATLVLPTANRRLESYTTGELFIFHDKYITKIFNLIAFAAAHVMADPLADTDSLLDTAIDWEKTVHFRHYLWDLGLGVAEAMDTAQRGGGLDWPGGVN